METVSKIRVVLIDSQQLMLECLRDRLNSELTISVVGTALNSDDGIRLVDELQPDVIVADMEVPGRGVFESINDLRARHRQLKILILTSLQSDILLAHAIQVKANGYVLKTEPLSAVIDAIQAVAAGHPVFSELIRSRLDFNSEQNSYTLKINQAAADLTARQLEVLRHLARGASVKEVAKLMHLSQKSVDSHKYRIMNKLGIHDRVDLTRYAIREQIIEA
ncbi:MAG: response regulator transcription factor [Planctomycetota bacterium]